jgi:S1-C subfamily serine protease
MITNSVLQRTFSLECQGRCGTCFTIDVAGRQYIVTARHLVEGLDGRGEIHLFREKMWQTLPVTLVGRHSGEADIAVLAADRRLSPDLPLEARSGGLALGQDVYFLGFPYRLHTDVGALNRDFPLPFVKKATLSCLAVGEDGVSCFFLDGHNNPGFSGGPVVFTRPGELRYRVAAVISGFRTHSQPVYRGEEPSEWVTFENTGIILAYGIRHAVDLIKANPIGLELGD